MSVKLLLHLLLFSPAYVLDCAIMWWLFRYPLVSLVFMLPAGFALQVLSFCVGIFFDLKRPILNWTHPQQAMKNNMNVLMGIGGSAGVVGVAAALCALLVLAGVDTLLVGCAAAMVLAGAAALLLPRLLIFADRQYSGGLELGGRGNNVPLAQPRAELREGPAALYFFLNVIPSAPLSMVIVAPSAMSPASIILAMGFCTRFCIVRFSGRAPYSGS